MTKLTYKRTHRLLMKANDENFTYKTVELDINSGLFKKAEVDSAETLIRVNNEIFGEAFYLTTSKALTVKDIQKLQDQFNSVRAEKGWHSVEFRTTKKVESEEVSDSSKVQRQEVAETV